MANKGKATLPKGVRWRDARKGRNSGHQPPRPSGGGSFEISCPNAKCSRKWSSDSRYHNPIRCGVKAPTVCPECGEALPQKGYTRVRSHA